MTTATMYIIIWALAFVFFVVIEVANGSALISIWFAIAALIAMFCAIAKLSLLMQLIVFVISSIILLILTKSIVKKVQNKVVPTNFELDVGKTAMVIERIDNSVNKGRVRLDGTDWAARSQDGSAIEEGVPVTVVKVDSAKLVVTKN
ncbi:MAG: NfeD family protein [Ruminococcus sp.]|nr:NfeD family protein [Ruminococcus sp.]